MLSVNHSVEDIHNYPYPQRTSQVNPNLSSTNISQLNHPRAIRSPLSSFTPITPPTSNSPTPVFEKSHFFSLGSNAGSTVSLDTFASVPEEPVSESWLLKALPKVNLEVVSMCALWYGFSIVSSNSTKAILSRFQYPVTLTQFQFILNALMCVTLFVALTVLPTLALRFPKGSVPDLHSLNHSVKNFLTPNAFIISTTLPMGLFQFVGHITSHKATSVIPVSLVHTIKALSPITTVCIYRFVYKVPFKRVTYLTLVPLMAGIMLTCYKPKRASLPADDHYFQGLIYAFISMFIFVSQNIFAKKRLTVEPEQKTNSLPSFKKDDTKKLDKLTILLFCSVLGFLFTMPFYILLEARNDKFSLAQMTNELIALVFLNGVSHFMQSLLAFLLLGTISPINYSIANIMKRIVVIIVAFIWESSFGFSGIQTFGIVLTVMGLYCYDRWGIARNK
ncbi:CIC11C00000003931 [Sungouiella intermedia]|uniref:CIC11C00000003931 n=1 Tax=Sungouiella intermedia TaxID=45354 RepID=A0A1L0BMG7_9ASCO|nr:CIC11C00000003931 [[Candida] intermedia]